jgi:hypothetical protein
LPVLGLRPFGRLQRSIFPAPLPKKRIISELSKVFDIGQIEKITTDILVLSPKGTNEVL